MVEVKNKETNKVEKEKTKESQETKKEQPEKEVKNKDKKTKKGKKTKQRPKKDNAKVNARSLPISTKYGVALCNFIRGEKISKAIEELEKIPLKKVVLPMKGEIAHKKGKGISSGKYPVKSTKILIEKLKELQANSMHNGLEEPIIKTAIANMAQRPFGQFGRVKRKRTHVQLIACESTKKINNNKKNK
jgi:ribosomal protein L22